MSRPALRVHGYDRYALIGLLGISLVFVGHWAGAGLKAADLTGPQPNDRQVALAVTSLLRKEHLSKHPIDDEMSRKFYKGYLKVLDPLKDYFIQSDIDSFAKYETELDDQLKRGDISFAYTVYQVFLKRIDERAKLVGEILAKDIDFTVDEDRITDPDATRYAQNDDEVRDKWNKRVKYDLLIQKADGKKDAEAREKIGRRYRSIAKLRHQMTNDDLLEMYLTACTTAFDPHTDYMSPSTLENFDIQMRLQLEGIGAALSFDDGFTVVSKLIPGGAADKDGHLKPKDRVIGVGQGTDGEIVDVEDMNLNEVVKLIRGKRGTVVRLKVVPAGQVEPKTYDITRASIELKDSEARAQIIEDSRKADGTPYKIGVIDLPSFYMDMAGARQGLSDFKSTTRDVKKILADFRAQGVDAVILDLRKNGGGSLTEAISLTGLFIDEGPIVQVKDSAGRVQHYDDQDKGTDWSGPLVVLTSKFSASASEIFAGAIKDYRRGLIVGDHTTHGKGTVQSLLDLGHQLFQQLPNAPSLGALKITMQQFYRPNGDSTQERGVEADIELPSVTSYWDVGEQDLPNHLKFDHVDPVSFAKLQMVDGNLIKELQTLSEKRCEKSTDFDKVRSDIVRYKKQKDRKNVPLNEQKFLADRGDSNPEKDEEKELEEQNDPKRPVVKRDYYFNEAMSVTLDYLRLMKVASAN
jgi:carboxyl-terminal processing protease